MKSTGFLISNLFEIVIILFEKPSFTRVLFQASAIQSTDPMIVIRHFYSVIKRERKERTSD